MQEFFAELRRRHVFRVALAYLVVAWLVLQVVNVLAPLLDVPLWVSKSILLFLIAGFPVALVLAWAFELTPEGVKRAEDADAAAPAPTAASTGRKLDFVIIGALVLALGYFGWDQYYDVAPSQPAVQSGPSTAAADMPSIAVLPFVNLSSDPEQEYFSDGLSEELLNQLAQIPGLSVTGRTSAFVFKGHNEDLRAIGEKLGVANILEGSVRKSGNRLRITAQLVNAADGYHLWSEIYERELDDVFAIQEDVARAVTAALGVTLGVGETERVAGGTTNLEAYDKYLRARALFYQSGPTELLRSIEIYREALALDPQFALAWYGLYTALGYSLVSVPRNSDEARKQMATASARIVALAPDAWWTHAMRADQALLQHRWSDAEAAASAALASAPSSEVDALVAYATFLMYVGRINEAVEIFSARARWTCRHCASRASAVVSRRRRAREEARRSMSSRILRVAADAGNGRPAPPGRAAMSTRRQWMRNSKVT
jgi:TolB-like protein